MNSANETRTKIQASRNVVREIMSRAESLTSEAIWTRKAWWLVHSDEDHDEGVQCLLIAILETLGSEILDFGASASKMERFHVVSAIRAHGFERVNSSRISAALRRWARGAEQPHVERELAVALGEIEIDAASACAFRGVE